MPTQQSPIVHLSLQTSKTNGKSSIGIYTREALPKENKRLPNHRKINIREDHGPVQRNNIQSPYTNSIEWG
ncbi:hypothetical protein JTE90_005834 [Oedothorax gibbosus]|uniref:Uncharacterized protein n=1 Tax=Oedothorax gibbosus TaxID=931172 RepID=A0AAV6V4J1_9ARAC|nr:hypothetical protein JTE90_005834 [Oedothorax gibbosus]